MKAIQFDRLGGPEVMELREVPKPVPRPGQVLVRNRVISLNFGDTWFIRGQYLVQPQFPDTPGMEGAGIVETVGPGVSGLAPGMRVAYIGMGAFAEYIAIRASRAIPIPEAMDFEQAAAFPIAAVTAWHLLHTCHRLAVGQRVIVHSAAGGVGIAAVQIAKAYGAEVIGTVSSDDKLALARQYGADHVINYERADFAAEALRLTEGRGVDLILDAVGQATFARGLQCLAPFGHLLLYGRAGGAPAPFNPLGLMGKALTVSAFAVPMVYAMHDIHRRGLDDVFRLAAEGKLTIPIGRSFALAEAVEAMRYLESRRSTGKLLLIP